MIWNAIILLNHPRCCLILKYGIAGERGYAISIAEKLVGFRFVVEPGSRNWKLPQSRTGRLQLPGSTTNLRPRSSTVLKSSASGRLRHKTRRTLLISIK
ncbi:unnamed protein product, partial [Nesidiocoris tenuis]